MIEQAEAANQLLESGKTAEALAMLTELDRDYPNQPEVVGCLVNACYDLGDMSKYEYHIRRLYKLVLPNSSLVYGLAGAFLVNNRPALALRTFQEALRRWPEHPNAADSRQQLSLLEKALQAQADEIHLPLEQALELLNLHDEVRYHMAHGQFHQARRFAEKLLSLSPNFISALNNLGQIYAVEGDIAQAILMAQRVLEIEADNIHALSNLARLHFLNGQPEQANQYAARLKASRADATDRWTKIAEALSFLGDDEGVLALYKQAHAAGELEPPFTDAIFYHLLAVSACHLGKEKKASKYWEKALKINPHFEWAQENLADIKKPASERSGAWAYSFENWLFTALAKEMPALLQKHRRIDRKNELQAVVARFFNEKHPRLIFLAPFLVARGDVKSREFVVHMAAISAHPALLEAAMNYISGQRGSFKERFQLARVLAEAELIKSNTMRMWSGDSYQDMMLFNVQISFEAEKTNRSRQVQLLYEEAWEALCDRDGKQTQLALEKAIKLRPNDPTLLNNLAAAYEIQGQKELAHQMLHKIHASFPNYLFGITGVARLETVSGNLDKAHELLDSLMQRKEMHISEFIAFCEAQIEVFLAEKNHASAQSWLEMWQHVDEKHPRLNFYRQQIKKAKKMRYPQDDLDKIK